mmetsp:Transcript_86010/g.239367  ORF Transcript_86010/g.239367 Transcript_86010/m.239367 type:complete len:215 (+) Transcript_86010:491-1135(+)
MRWRREGARPRRGSAAERERRRVQRSHDHPRGLQRRCLPRRLLVGQLGAMGRMLEVVQAGLPEPQPRRPGHSHARRRTLRARGRGGVPELQRARRLPHRLRLVGLEVVDRVLRCLRHRCADAGPRLHPGGAGREAVQRLGVHADGELPRVERTLPEGGVHHRRAIPRRLARRRRLAPPRRAPRGRLGDGADRDRARQGVRRVLPRRTPASPVER